MTRSKVGLRPVVRLVLALVLGSSVGLGLGGAIGTPAVEDVAAAGLPAWHGGIDLYRKGTFTTQQSWLWCTAADVQIMRNITHRQHDHSASNQRRYFTWMRGHNRYNLPLSAGVDPAGWTAGLRHFVDGRYRLVASRTFASALRSAVINLRRTNLPVGITVSHGNHAWILTGFTATADPLKTSKFTVTSVRVVGPLFGLQSKNGYDMPPDTKLSPSQLRNYFTAWRYAPKRMIWDGRFVSIQPIPAKAVAPAPAAPKVTPKPSKPSIAPSPSASGASSPSPSPSPVSTDDGVLKPALATPSSAAATSGTTTTGSDGPGPGLAIALTAIGLAAAVMVVGIGRNARRSSIGSRAGQRR